MIHFRFPLETTLAEFPELSGRLPSEVLFLIGGRSLLERVPFTTVAAPSASLEEESLDPVVLIVDSVQISQTTSARPRDSAS